MPDEVQTTRAPQDVLSWTGAQVPVSTLYDDPFYAVSDGLAESRYVFLRANGLPERFAPGFHIAELGFGTGLNAIAAWMAWEASGQAGALRFTSFEAHPMDADARRKALAAWPEVAAYGERLAQALEAGPVADLGSLRLEVVEGFAAESLARWEGAADAWFLDGFNPAKNPEMWSEGLMREVAAHTRSGGSFATYTAAGHVRRALEAAGFAVQRQPGFGNKRHMSLGRL